MNGMDLLDAMEHIDPEYIEKAENYRARKKKKVPLWVGSIAAAACVCLVVGISVWNMQKTARVYSVAEALSDEAPMILGDAYEEAPEEAAVEEAAGSYDAAEAYDSIEETAEDTADYAAAKEEEEADTAADIDMDAYPRMVMLKGVLYYDSGEISTETRSSDGTIEESVSFVPEKDGQSNFGTGYEFRYGENPNTVDVFIDDAWYTFLKYDGWSETVNQYLSIQKGTSDSDAPVNEDTYSEARSYSPEVMDLQSRISAAMANRELPFVVSSSILENPDRVHVVVTTTNKEDMDRLKGYDLSGRLIEIEYREGAEAAEE